MSPAGAMDLPRNRRAGPKLTRTQNRVSQPSHLLGELSSCVLAVVIIVTEQCKVCIGYTCDVSLQLRKLNIKLTSVDE